MLYTYLFYEDLTIQITTPTFLLAIQWKHLLGKVLFRLSLAINSTYLDYRRFKSQFTDNLSIKSSFD